MAKASDYLVALDDGHGPQTAGKRTPYIASLGRQIRENEFNKAVVDLLDTELKRCGFRTLQLAPTDADTPLNTRTNTANQAKASLLISVHFNAMGSTFAYSQARGFSVHIQPADKSNVNSGSLKFAKLAIEELAKGTPQVNRGVVGQNLAMTRESKMPAVLVECGFMDDEKEALLMIDAKFHREVSQELARAVCRYFGIPYVNEVIAEVSVTKPQDTKEAIRLFKPTTDTLNNEMYKTLDKAHKDGILTSEQWAQKAKDGTLTLDDAIALTATIVRRSYLDADK